MKAIKTSYLPFTNTKPSRIKASAEGVKSEIYTCNALDYFREREGVEHLTNHQAAARLFAHDNHWSTKLASGGLPSGEWAHCFVTEIVKPAPPPKSYTVIAVSSNANSFGYKSVLALAEDGEGLEFLVQAYGCEVVPVRGDIVHKGEPRFFGAPRNLPRVSAEQAKAILKEVKL